MIELKKLVYQDYLKLEPNFISLDISVNSTGWVRSINGEVDWGTYALQSISEFDRREEFRKFIKNLFKDNCFSVVFIEDVIAGTNFKTTKGLIQLNTIVDDLNLYGIINVEKIERIDNKKWKKFLVAASNYNPDIKCEEDKKLICNCLNELSFYEKVAQDIYDAMGIAIAIIYRNKILNITSKTDSVLHTDIRKNYLLKQFSLNDVKLDKYVKNLESKYSRTIENIDWTSEKRDIVSLFKKKIKQDDKDDLIYIMKVNSMKLGILALKKNWNVDESESIIVATKKK